MLLPADPETRSNERHSNGRLILVSNRGPIEHYIDLVGRIRQRNAGGGVAVALSSVARHEPVTWIAAASGFADKVIALMGKRVSIAPDSTLQLIDLDEQAYDAYYNTFCNPLLWFVQHWLGESMSAHRDVARDALEGWETGYVPVNLQFARAVIDEIDRRPDNKRVMIHDYHLYLAPRLVREARPEVTLQQFVHIPWPAPAAWSLLPDEIVREICDGLLANDSVGFQTDACVENFMATCRAYLGDEAEVQERIGEVTYRGQTTSAWCNPISVDVAELRELAASEEVQEHKKTLVAPEGMKTIVRVDRLDPSKNVLRGFEAYERLLETRPDLIEKVRFIAYLVPSRVGIPEYDSYAEAVFEAVARINRRFGNEEWKPVIVQHEQNREKAFAGLALYDVLLVNSVADGMNLVSKEGVVVNERDGVLLLSTRAGSFNELERGSVALDPMDVESSAAALWTALDMSAEERKTRSSSLRNVIDQYQLGDWLRHQLKDLTIMEYIRQGAASSSLATAG